MDAVPVRGLDAGAPPGAGLADTEGLLALNLLRAQGHTATVPGQSPVTRLTAGLRCVPLRASPRGLKGARSAGEGVPGAVAVLPSPSPRGRTRALGFQVGVDSAPRSCPSPRRGLPRGPPRASPSDVGRLGGLLCCLSLRLSRFLYVCLCLSLPTFVITAGCLPSENG